MIQRFRVPARTKGMTLLLQQLGFHQPCVVLTWSFVVRGQRGPGLGEEDAVQKALVYLRVFVAILVAPPAPTSNWLTNVKTRQSHCSLIVAKNGKRFERRTVLHRS